jgi:hypothetical protein
VSPSGPSRHWCASAECRISLGIEVAYGREVSVFMRAFSGSLWPITKIETELAAPYRRCRCRGSASSIPRSGTNAELLQCRHRPVVRFRVHHQILLFDAAMHDMSIPEWPPGG